MPERAEIVDAALTLMGERGVAGASMRSLAAALDCNVATLYHHFPSKADLFRAVIAERGYTRHLGTDPLPVPGDGTAAERLTALLDWLWAAFDGEAPVTRLLVGEGLRGEVDARDASRALLGALDAGLARWLAEAVPELDGQVPAAARLIHSSLSLAIEDLVLGADDARAAERRDDLVAILLSPVRR